jgi:AraC-like DNA-binding protein
MSGAKTMDPRVHEVMQLLRKQALTPYRSDSDAATGESKNKQEQKVSLEEMALKLGLSESRLRALFKSQVGLPPTQYVIKIRMKNAAKGLRETYERVTEIAAGLGFDSDSYFTRAFKKTYGMTPTQYRKFHQQPSEKKEKDDDPSGR